MRHVNGLGPGGAGGTAGPEPGDVKGGRNSPVNADIPYDSQAENTDNVRDYWLHDLDATLGWLVRIPPAEYEKRLKRFRRGYGRIVEMARDPRARLEIRGAFSKVWKRWRRRSVANYPESLRDQIFAEAEIEREVWAVGWARVADLPLFKPPMPAEADAMLAKHSGHDRFVAWLISHPRLVAEVIPHLRDRDIPRELLLFVYRFVLVAVREPDKLTAFWLDHRDVLDRLMEPLVGEAQARLDELNPSKVEIDEEVMPLAPVELQPPLRQIEEEPPPPAAPEASVEVPSPESLPPTPRETWVPPLSAPAVPAAIIEANALTPAEIATHNLNNALAHARAGIPIHPVRVTWNSRRKKWDKPPAIDDWQQGSTTDEERIRAWWRDLPVQLGIPAHHFVAGIWCGHPDLKLLVIDCDRHGAHDGVAEFEALVDQNWLPIGPVTKTPSNGFHYIFKVPPGETFGDTRGSLPDGIDVRGAGLIVAPGSIRADGATWRGRPSLLEAFPKGLVPELPDWIAALIRTPKRVKEKTPKEEQPTPQAEPIPRAAPSGTRKAPLEICRKWAAAALEGNAAELAAAKPGQRNTLANLFAYRSGRMVEPGWIREQDVVEAYMTASEVNGKIRDDGGPEKIRATIESGLGAGRRKPLRELPDRPWQPWRPIDGRDDTPWLRVLRSEVRALYRLRFAGNSAAIDEADQRVWEIIKITTDPWKIGHELCLKHQEYQRLASEAHGRKRGPRLPGTMRPSDVPREAVEALIKERNRERDRAYRANKRAKERGQQIALNDLDDRESVVLTFLQQHPDKQHSIDDIGHGVRRNPLFKKMNPKSRKNAIRRIVSGKLSSRINVKEVLAKNRGSKIMVQIKN